MNSNSPWMWLWNVKCNKIQILVIVIWTFLFTVPHSGFFFLFSIFTKKCTITALNLFFLSPPNLCSYKNMVVNECLCNTITLLQYFFSELSFVIFPVFNYFRKITNLIVVDKHFSKSASSKITAGFFPPSWNRDTCSRIYRYNQLKKDKASHPYLLYPWRNAVECTEASIIHTLSNDSDLLLTLACFKGTFMIILFIKIYWYRAYWDLKFK